MMQGRGRGDMMTEIDLGARLAQTEIIARRAGDLALKHFRSRDSLAIETKRNLTDMVSIADREVETMIRDALRAAFPADAMLGKSMAMHRESPG